MRPRLPLVPALALSGLLLLGTAAALAQAEADRRLDAAIARLRTALGPGATLEIGARRLDPVTGRATLNDVTLTQGTDRTTIPEAILSDLSDTRIGRAELLRVTSRGNGTAADAARLLVTNLALPAPGQPFALSDLAFASAEAEALRIATMEMKMGVERLSMRDVRGTSLAAGTLEGLDYRGTGTDPDRFTLRRIALDAVTAPLVATPDPADFRAGRILLEGADLRAPSQGTTFSLNRLELRDWIPDRATYLLLDNLRAAGPAPQIGLVEARLERIEATGIDAAGTVTALMSGRQAPDPFPNTTQRLLLEGFDSTAEGRPLLAIRRLLSEGRMDNAIAAGVLALEGFRLALPPGQAGWLTGLGYAEVTGGTEIRGTMPRAGGRLEMDPWRITWDGATTLGLVFQLDGMPALAEPGAVVDPGTTLAGMAQARLAGLTFTLRDTGLLGRVIAQQAREQRIPPARLREQWAQMALSQPLPGERPAARPAPRAAPGARPAPPPGPATTPAPAASPDALMPLRQAVASFIRQPGTLEITMRPPKPVGFAELQAAGADAPAAIRMLGLTATAR